MNISSLDDFLLPEESASGFLTDDKLNPVSPVNYGHRRLTCVPSCLKISSTPTRTPSSRRRSLHEAFATGKLSLNPGTGLALAPLSPMVAQRPRPITAPVETKQQGGSSNSLLTWTSNSSSSNCSLAQLRQGSMSFHRNNSSSWNHDSHSNWSASSQYFNYSGSQGGNKSHKSSLNGSFRSDIMIAQRSCSKEVKAVLTNLACLDGDSNVDVKEVEDQCSFLAQLVQDAFYQVVVSKYGGPRILGHVMKLYPDQANIQEAGCVCFLKMGHNPYLQTHGVELLTRCLDRHATSISVQSAACQALLAIWEASNNSLEASNEGCDSWKADLPQIYELVDRAAHMFLTPNGLNAAQRIRKALSQESIDE